MMRERIDRLKEKTELIRKETELIREQNQRLKDMLSKIRSKGSTLISLTLFLFLTLTPASAFAAAGGRISSGGFLSPSESSSSSLSYSSPAPSYSSPSRNYSNPGPIPSPPSRPRYEEEDDFYIPFPEVFLPSPPRERTVYIPVPSPTPDPIPSPPRVETKPQPEVNGPVEAKGEATSPPSPALSLAFILAFGLLALVFLTRDPLISSKKEQEHSRPYTPSAPPRRYTRPEETIHLYRLRVALLASAKDIQADLLKLAEENETNFSEGLSEILRETTLSILRHPEKVVYCDSFSLSGGGELEQKFLSLAFEERSKISSEIVSSVSGTLNESGEKIGSGSSADNEFILVSILVAATLKLGEIPVETADQLHSSLVKIGSISPGSLCALEIIWQPEGEAEVLTKEELLSLYPDLQAI
jgi:uncharacterized membrane protein